MYIVSVSIIFQSFISVPQKGQRIDADTDADADANALRNFNDDVSIRLRLRRHLQDDRDLPRHDGPATHPHGNLTSYGRFGKVP